MKTEEATCKVAPSPTQISNPFYNVKDGVIEYSLHTGVTSSTLSIESPHTQKLYIPPLPEKPKKEKDIRFACLGHIQKLKGVPSTAKAIMTWLVMERQWRSDRLLIVGKGECAERFGKSRRQVIRLFHILEESNCLRIVKRGGSTRGSRREANTYALGSIFDALPPKEAKHRPVTKMSLVREGRPVTKMSDDQCQECHSLPIFTPYKNTHTKELLSAFNKENWLIRGKEKYPDWDVGNLNASFFSAEARGVNGTWTSYQDKCYSLRFKATIAPARPSSVPRPAVRSSCESPKQADLDYNDPKILEEALFVALSNGETPACILAGVKDPALAQSVLAKAEARIETPRNRSRMP